MIEIIYEKDSPVNGEEPPIIFIRGTQDDYSALLQRTLQYEREAAAGTRIDLSDFFIIDYGNLKNITLAMCDRCGADIMAGTISLTVGKKQLSDINTALKTLAHGKCTVFFECEWLGVLFGKGSIIAESALAF